MSSPPIRAPFPDPGTRMRDGGAEAASRASGPDVTAGSISWLANPVVFSFLLALAAVPGVIQVFWGPDDNDVAWGLYVAGRILDGAKLYVDMIEVNPPLIFILSIPAKLLSRLTGVSDILMFELMVLAFTVVSLALCAALLRRIAPSGKDILLRRGFLVVAVFALYAVPSNSNVFAQREHIMVILLLPYLLAAAARSMGATLRGSTAVWIGLLAGVGIALKPFFVLPWVLVEVYLAVRLGPKRAWLRPENVVIAGVGLLYLGLVAVVFPEYFALVAVLREVYGSFLPTTYSDMLTDQRAIYVVAAVLAVRFTGGDESTWELRKVLLLATTGFAAALLVQHKGFMYHWYPVMAGATLLLGIALLDSIRVSDAPKPRALGRRAGFVIASVMFVLMAANTVLDVSEGLNPPPNAAYQRDLTPRATRIIREQAGGESVGALSALPEPMFPAVNYTGVRWASHFMHLWPLNGPYAAYRWSNDPVRYHRPDQMGRAEHLLYTVEIDDMLRDPPRLLFVMVPPAGTLPTPRFDYIKYFSQDPRFAQAMKDYKMIAVLGEYAVYKRMSGQRAVPGAADSSHDSSQR